MTIEFVSHLIISIISTIALVLIYFLPTLIAKYKNHNNFVAIFLTNLLFSWTFIGWFFSLIWAVKNPAEVIIKQQN